MLSTLKKRFTFICFLAAGLCLLNLGCEREGEVSKAVEISKEKRIDKEKSENHEVLKNAMKGLPGNLYASQVDSPIHWQPLSKACLEMAKAKNRLIFAVVATPTNSDYIGILDHLNSDSSIVEELNNNFVPILIDGNVLREMTILSAFLSLEINSEIKLPMMLWLSPEGNPVGWLPITEASEETFVNAISQSNEILLNMWEEDRSYVSENSQNDRDTRVERILSFWEGEVLSENVSEDTERALRQLIALYDPISRKLDETASFFPTGALRLLTLGAQADGLDDRLKKRSEEVLTALMEDILPSAMFDPIDGGAFAAKDDYTWSLPSFERDCVSQAEIVKNLLQAYDVTGDERALIRALGILTFIDESYSLENGGFILSDSPEIEIEDWLWDFDEIKTLLTPAESEVWIAATGMKPGGNLSAETDPSRKYGDANSIGFVLSEKQIAESQGTDVAAVAGLLESSREKLADSRRKKIGPKNLAQFAHAEATFQVASAYAAAYRTTGDTKFRDQAVKTMTAARELFSDGSELFAHAPGDFPKEVIAGRALLYAIAMNSVLDIYAITLDEKWLSWTDTLAAISAEKFTGKVLRECDPEDTTLDLEVFDMTILYGPASVGTFSMVEARLQALGRPVSPSFSELCAFLSTYAIQAPTIYADSIASSLVRIYGEKILYGPEISEEMKALISRAPLELSARLSVDKHPEDGKKLGVSEAVRMNYNGETENLEDASAPVLIPQQ